MKDMDRAWRVAREISETMTGYYIVRDWTQERGNLFQAVRTEKTVMWVILSLIIAVAAFNIISMLVMVVTDKQSDIAILKTMGARPGTSHADIRHPGQPDRDHRYRHGCRGRHSAGAKHRFRGAVSWNAFLDSACFPSDIYYITELAIRPQSYGRHQVRPDVTGNVAVVHHLSLLARVQDASRRGAEL